MDKRLFFITLFLLPSLIFSQDIQRVRFFQNGWKVSVLYDLLGQPNEIYTIDLYFSKNRGETFQGPLLSVQGDHGKVMPGTNREIIWNAKGTIDPFISDDVVMKVVAKIQTKVDTGTISIPIPPMVYIPGGTFVMGCDVKEFECYEGESPLRKVTLDDFYLGKYEITFDEYDAFCQATYGNKLPNNRGRPRGKNPVGNVSWYDAIEYCNWLSEQVGLKKVYSIDKRQKDPHNNNSSFDDPKWLVKTNWNASGFRLPTEAEWEYAAREKGKPVLFGNGKNRINPKEINFDPRKSKKKAYADKGIYRKTPVPVGSLNSPNKLGLYNMSGNVYEWCWDWKKTYPTENESNPIGPVSNEYSLRVRRGGSYYSLPEYCRVFNRSGAKPSSDQLWVGFRIARRF